MSFDETVAVVVALFAMGAPRHRAVRPLVVRAVLQPISGLSVADHQQPSRLEVHIGEGRPQTLKFNQSIRAHDVRVSVLLWRQPHRPASSLTGQQQRSLSDKHTSPGHIINSRSVVSNGHKTC